MKIIKIGDLVQWESSGGEKELGIVIKLDEPNAFDPMDQVLVYFFKDAHPSMIRVDDLEALCK